MNETEKIYYVVEITEKSPFESLIGKRYYDSLKNEEDMTHVIINKLFPFEKLIAENISIEEAERLCEEG